jgi:hypothetical protein
MSWPLKEHLKGWKMDKQVSQKAARRYLRTIANSKEHFYTYDNQVLKNLWELYAFLKSCDEVTFRHHVNETKNDFANWVEDIILDGELAKRMDHCVSRGVMQLRVLSRINFLVSMSSQSLFGPKKARMIMEEAVAPEEFFITVDGRSIRSLWELKDLLDRGSAEVFAYHVNEGKNDIADWVEEVVFDKELSNLIRGVKDKDEMSMWVNKRLQELEKKAIPQKSPRRLYYLQVMRGLKRRRVPTSV